MALVKNMMEIILLVIAFTAIAGAERFQNSELSLHASREFTENINCPIHYFKSVHFVSLVSSHLIFTTPISPQFVLDFKPYVTSFKDFEYAYPSFIIAVNGVAYSDAIFGDVAKDKFGNLSYPTSHFFANGTVNYINLVDNSTSKWGAHYARVKIDLGFQKKGTKLFVLPRLEGEVVGHGFYSKDLSIALNIQSITFKPRGMM
ncbi:hypothetical protein PV325_006331 [Microctonus aethiopoides]|nr:hypothetical protein PV325_006331 [Microctonus aethiopoides]